MKEPLRPPLRPALPVALAALLLSACATTAPAPRAAAYSEARAACEFVRGGRPGRERRSADGAGARSHLAACLERRGWHTDGTPTLQQLLREGR